MIMTAKSWEILILPQQQPFHKLKGQHPRSASDYVLISFAMCLLYSARIYRESEDLRGEVIQWKSFREEM